MGNIEFYDIRDYIVVSTSTTGAEHAIQPKIVSQRVKFGFNPSFWCDTQF